MKKLMILVLVLPTFGFAIAARAAEPARQPAIAPIATGEAVVETAASRSAALAASTAIAASVIADAELIAITGSAAGETHGAGGPYEPATAPQSTESDERWRISIDPRDERRFAPQAPRPLNSITIRFWN